jgi:hypothetical protein
MITTDGMIILLLSIMVGMIFSILWLPTEIYHGPNAAKIMSKTYYYPGENKCYRFQIVKGSCSDK